MCGNVKVGLRGFRSEKHCTIVCSSSPHEFYCLSGDRQCLDQGNLCNIGLPLDTSCIVFFLASVDALDLFLRLETVTGPRQSSSQQPCLWALSLR